MTEYELVWRYRVASEKLAMAGYKVSVVQSGMYIHNDKGTIVGEVKTVDGLQGFLQGVEWADAKVAGALT